MGSELRQVLDSSLLELTSTLDSQRNSEVPSHADFQSKGSSSVATSIDPHASKPEVVTAAEMQDITLKYERMMEERESEYKAQLHEETR
jgi:adenine deaminase